MNILALDTSSQVASCAFLEDNVLIGEFYNNAKITHSQTILPMIDTMLKSCRRSINDVDVFALAIGPGSYTGLRIGLSVIKGFAFKENKLSAPVSSLEGLAYNVLFRQGIIAAVINARRQRVYTALFSSDGEKLSRLTEDKILPITELGQLLKTTQHGENAVLVGDGALLCKNQLSSTLPNIILAPENLIYQRGASIAFLARKMAEENRLVSSFDMEPNYLLITQAERELNEQKDR